MKTHKDLLDDLPHFAQPHAKLAYMGVSNGKKKEILAAIKKLLATEKSNSNEEKGNALEELVNTLLTNAGVFGSIKRNFKDDRGDLDHFFILLDDVWSAVDKTFATRYGNRVAGESKNHPEDKIDVTIVYKLEALKYLNDIRLGCYFTRKGSTGANNIHAAKSVIRGFRLKAPESPSVVFSNKDWVFLESNPFLFSALLYEKFSYVITDKDSENVNYDDLLSYTKLPKV